jgi:hypothetical protein
VLQRSTSEGDHEFNANGYNVFSRRASVMNIALTASDDILEGGKLPVVVIFDGRVHFEWRKPPAGQRFVVFCNMDYSRTGMPRPTYMLGLESRADIISLLT